jgi:ribonuclease P protein component
MALRPDILRYRKDFDRLYKKGRSTGDRYIVVFYIANDLGYTRKAFLASKKVGGAVARNRARRLMKESFRGLERDIKPGKDVLMIARSTITGAKCAEVEVSMRKALAKSGLLK